jgi:hypoxanthine-DNA glycosylase
MDSTGSHGSRGFPPIAAVDARVLVLGSLPGQASLSAHQYYAQPQNAFWRIMCALFDADPSQPYAERASLLVARRIALWDVCRAAVRSGSRDASIELRSVVVNDFAAFFRAHPGIEAVYCNGGMAYRLYERLVLPRLSEPARALPRERLPSTSPAYAGLRYEEKLAQWERIALRLAG